MLASADLPQSKLGTNQQTRGKAMNSQSQIMKDEQLQQLLGNLFATLIDTSKEEYDILHLIIETREAQGKLAVLFTWGCPRYTEDYSTLVAEKVAEAAFAVVQYFLMQEGSYFPGLELLLSKQGPDKWASDFHLLDEPDQQWSRMPRFPVRVCGYGLSLAAHPTSFYRWTRTEDPFRIVAAARPGTAPATDPGKRVQIDFKNNNVELRLGDGVKDASEIIEICEGPISQTWVIETPIFCALWPNGLDLRCPAASRTAFDLVDQLNSLVFVQGPFPSNKLSIDDMGSEGQTETARGLTAGEHPWVEFAYDLDDKSWRQRQYIRQASSQFSFVITAQCLSTNTKIYESAEVLVDSLSPPIN